MSEPTSGHNPPQAPEPGQGQDPVQDQTQEEAPGSVVNDPTVPVWSNPTAPIPPPPAPPRAAAPVPPPVNGPYSPQPAQPYGQQPDPYVQPWPGQQYQVHGQQSYPYGPPTEANASAIVLTILSALSLCNLLTVASLVLGIVALTKNSTDPEGSRRLTKIGWIVFAAAWALVIVGLVGVVALGILSSSTSPSNSSF
jgi:hypothetical protein